MNRLPERRFPSANPIAENHVIGAILMEKAGIVHDMCFQLTPEDFTDSSMKMLYTELAFLYVSGKEVSAVSLKERIDGQLPMHRLVELMEIGNSGVSSVEGSIESLKRLTLRRKLANFAARLPAIVESTEEIETIIEQAETELLKISSQRNLSATPLKDLLAESYDLLLKGQRQPCISTGFFDLDGILDGGFHEGEMIVLAGRPSMGKTSLGLCIIRQIAGSGVPVGFLSLEMRKQQIGNILLCQHAQFPLSQYMKQSFGPEEFDAITKCHGELSFYPITVVDDIYDLSTLRNMIRHMVRVDKAKAVVVDYLGLIQCDDKKAGTRNDEVGIVSRSLKALAKQCNIPIIVLAQLNRKNENRDDKRPKLSDLRDSGNIEQDADLVMFVHRDEYYNIETDKKGQAEIIIAKNRCGPVGTVDLMFKKNWMRFDNMLPGGGM